MRAWMVELVDTQDLKSCSFGSVGSIPTRGTTLIKFKLPCFIYGKNV